MYFIAFCIIAFIDYVIILYGTHIRWPLQPHNWRLFTFFLLAGAYTGHTAAWHASICIFFRAKASLIVINKGYAPSFLSQLGNQQLFKTVKNRLLIVLAIDKTSVWQLKRLVWQSGLFLPAIGGEFDYQGWQVFIIVKITLPGQYKQQLERNNSTLRVNIFSKGCIPPLVIVHIKRKTFHYRIRITATGWCRIV
jgi:hypothetical protein